MIDRNDRKGVILSKEEKKEKKEYEERMEVRENTRKISVELSGEEV